MSARHLGVVPAADTYLSFSLSLAVVRPVESISRGQFRYDEENASAKNVDDEWKFVWSVAATGSRRESYRHRGARVSTAFSTGPGIDGGNNKGILRVLPRLHFDREHWVDRVRTIY